MQKFWNSIGIALGGLLVVLILYLNITLYYQPVVDMRDGHVQYDDLLQELRGLKQSLDDGAADDMQELYPEGYVFMNALYGLAWADVARQTDAGDALYREAFQEVERSCDYLGSETAREIFDEFLPLSYGAFYQGWYNYVVGRKLLLQAPSKRSPSEVAAFRGRCQDIAQAIQSDKTPYPPSYRFGAWPADVIVGVASLSLHDKLFKPHYQNVIDAWIKRVRAQLDGHGLIPHEVDPVTGAMREGARGSSQSLMLSFLPEIDSAFAREQFERYRALFIAHRFGLPCIREYPAGTVGFGDIDSGPVILHAGAAASLAGLRTLALYHEQQDYVGLRNSIEAFGVPMTHDGKKRYLFGQLPMADAFIAWGHAAASSSAKASGAWKLKFHIYSGLLVLLVAGTWMYFRKRRAKRSE
ncbi:hypothetical protein KK062_12460 [Fulvivirgaceae bacterium PWU5]|uniref:Uncharacterized protein n=1 Tax=Dawidia cretensis TaxID=2782350 RepID=A0AAP2DXB1_9BACT|nr:hypothetical protein [Dawidia cretensis]MBT1709045.1 hypothetical protein [Dawidia cretensis]